MTTCDPTPTSPEFKVLRAAKSLSAKDQWLLHSDVEGIVFDGDARKFAQAERVLLRRIGGAKNLDSYMAALRAGARS